MNKVLIALLIFLALILVAFQFEKLPISDQFLDPSVQTTDLFPW